MSGPILLRVLGAVARPLDLTWADLMAFPESYRVLDVARFHPGRRGDAITLDSLLRRAEPHPDAAYLTLHADRDDFHVCIPLAAVRPEGLVVFRLGELPLAVEQGGPIRFLIRDPAACHTDELDDCANVKYVDRIELSNGKGRDTRPGDDAAHAALHDHS